MFRQPLEDQRKDKYSIHMNSTLRTNQQVIDLLKKPQEKNSEYLEITGIKKSNLTSMSPPSIKMEIEMIIGSKTTTIWIKR